MEKKNIPLVGHITFHQVVGSLDNEENNNHELDNPLWVMK
jgi:hypothetical protein